MKKLLSMLVLSSIIMIGTTSGFATAQVENNTESNMGNGTTGSVINLTNASSSPQNMNVIEGTMNQTGP